MDTFSKSLTLLSSKIHKRAPSTANKDEQSPRHNALPQKRIPQPVEPAYPQEAPKLVWKEATCARSLSAEDYIQPRSGAKDTSIRILGPRVHALPPPKDPTDSLAQGLSLFYHNGHQFVQRILKVDDHKSYLYVLMDSTATKGVKPENANPKTIKVDGIHRICNGLESISICRQFQISDPYLTLESCVVIQMNSPDRVQNERDCAHVFLTPPEQHLRTSLESVKAQKKDLYTRMDRGHRWRISGVRLTDSSHAFNAEPRLMLEYHMVPNEDVHDKMFAGLKKIDRYSVEMPIRPATSTLTPEVVDPDADAELPGAPKSTVAGEVQEMLDERRLYFHPVDHARAYDVMMQGCLLWLLFYSFQTLIWDVQGKVAEFWNDTEMRLVHKRVEKAKETLTADNWLRNVVQLFETSGSNPEVLAMAQGLCDGEPSQPRQPASYELKTLGAQRACMNLLLQLEVEYSKEADDKDDDRERWNQWRELMEEMERSDRNLCDNCFLPKLPDEFDGVSLGSSDSSSSDSDSGKASNSGSAETEIRMEVDTPCVPTPADEDAAPDVAFGSAREEEEAARDSARESATGSVMGSAKGSAKGSARESSRDSAKGNATGSAKGSARGNVKGKVKGNVTGREDSNAVGMTRLPLGSLSARISSSLSARSSARLSARSALAGVVQRGVPSGNTPASSRGIVPGSAKERTPISGRISAPASGRSDVEASAKSMTIRSNTPISDRTNRSATAKRVSIRDSATTSARAIIPASIGGKASGGNAVGGATISDAIVL